MPDQKKVVLLGSERLALGQRTGNANAEERIDVSVILKPMQPVAVPAGGGSAVSREEFAAKHGADPAAIEAVKTFAAAHNLQVIEVSAERRTVKLEGTIGDLTKAFQADVANYLHNGREFRMRTGELQIPAELASSIEAVLGLDNRPQARAHFRIRPLPPGGFGAAATVSYTPVQVAQLYSFPAGLDGTGQTIGILELGGGYRPAELQKYFTSIKVKPPAVSDVLVDQAKNEPTTPDSADGEVLLDIEVAGAVAPGANIVVYFAPNTDQGFLDGLTTAIHDKTNKPSVISISWGGPENSWTAQAMKAFDSAAQDAAALGVTICAASGDDGSSDGVKDGANHVDFPASSPHILACGGTNLQSANGKITKETVWNDGAQGGAGGGGYSVQFPVPAYQSSAKVAPPAKLGRGVPDVAGDASPQTGYSILVDGQSMVIGGTSAVAPLWSGLIAVLNQKLGKPLGFIQPQLYSLAKSTGALNDITEGSNGAFKAAVGWDAATGLGSPVGDKLLAALSAPASLASGSVS
jgi:kumamolisin